MIKHPTPLISRSRLIILFVPFILLNILIINIIHEDCCGCCHAVLLPDTKPVAAFLGQYRRDRSSTAIKRWRRSDSSFFFRSTPESKLGISKQIANNVKKKKKKEEGRSLTSTKKKQRHLSTRRSSLSSRGNKKNNKKNQLKLKRPNLETQLNFARNGHCVLRLHIDSQQVECVGRQLVKYARQHELQAWQQKVEVAAGGNAKRNMCRTIAECQRELRSLLNNDARDGDDDDDDAENPQLPFLQFFHTWRSLPYVYQMCCQLAETASILLDVPSVRLYQDALFWKRTVDGVTPWHADARMAPFDTSSLITFWIPLHDVHRGGGGLVFCSKTHSDIALPYWNGSPETWEPLEQRYSDEELVVDYDPMKVGDITAHSGWTLHAADPVVSSSTDRMALAISFVDACAPIRDNLSSTGDDEDTWSYKDWVREVPTGSQDWNHPLVPVLWPRPPPPHSSSS